MTLRCKLFGHSKYRIVQKFSGTSRRIRCLRCGKDFGMNDEVRAVIPWTGELEQMYKDFGHKIKDPVWT